MQRTKASACAAILLALALGGCERERAGSESESESERRATDVPPHDASTHPDGAVAEVPVTSAPRASAAPASVPARLARGPTAAASARTDETRRGSASRATTTGIARPDAGAASAVGTRRFPAGGDDITIGTGDKYMCAGELVAVRTDARPFCTRVCRDDVDCAFDASCTGKGTAYDRNGTVTRDASYCAPGVR